MDQSHSSTISELEAYLLTCLQEELSEQIQEVGKIRRFGAKHTCPLTLKKNIQKFQEEAADTAAIAFLLNRLDPERPYPCHDFDPGRMAEKILRTQRYARTSANLGRLSEAAYLLLKEEIARATDC